MTGGDISFGFEHCKLTVCDSDNNKTMQFLVKPPHADTNDELHVPSSYVAHASCPAEVKPTYVESILLHNRLGHRSIPALVNASDNNVWADTKISFPSDHTCDDCKLSSARKAKRGSTKTEDALKVAKAGEAATIDIIYNLESEGLTESTHSKYYLLVCDVFSRFSVLLGMDDKSSGTVIQTIKPGTPHTGPLTDRKSVV